MTPITEDEIGEHICALLDKSDIDSTHAMLVLLGVMGSILTSISCKECRRLQAEAIKKTLASIVSDAMGRPGHANHTH